MPQLVKLQDELRDSGFAIIGPHSQGGDKDEISKIARGLKINFTVTDRFSIPGEEVSGLPMQFLFDGNGNLVAKDHHLKPQTIKDLVAKEPHFIAHGREYKKHKAEAESLKKSKAYGAVVKKLEKSLNGTGDAAEEAKYLTERLLAFGGKQLEAARASEAESPFKANQAYNELAVNWKGTEIATKASARVKELKDDKAFQEELKADKMYSLIVAESEKLIVQGGKLNLEYGPNQKTAATIKASAVALKRSHPKSKAAEKVTEMLKELGFKNL